MTFLGSLSSDVISEKAFLNIIVTLHHGNAILFSSEVINVILAIALLPVAWIHIWDEVHVVANCVSWEMNLSWERLDVHYCSMVVEVWHLFSIAWHRHRSNLRWVVLIFDKRQVSDSSSLVQIFEVRIANLNQRQVLWSDFIVIVDLLYAFILEVEHEVVCVVWKQLRLFTIHNHTFAEAWVPEARIFYL